MLSALGWQQWTINGLERDLEASLDREDVLEGKLRLAQTRVHDLLEDKESDEEIDNLDDDELRDAARRWILREAGNDSP